MTFTATVCLIFILQFIKLDVPLRYDSCSGSVHNYYKCSNLYSLKIKCTSVKMIHESFSLYYVMIYLKKSIRSSLTEIQYLKNKSNASFGF